MGQKHTNSGNKTLSKAINSMTSMTPVLVENTASHPGRK